MVKLSDESFLQSFVVETKEHLSEIEPDLLSLEKDGQHADAEVINRIFRAIHSVKGGAGFFGFEALKRLSHVMESLLMLIRDGKVSPEPDVVDALLAGVDKLNQMMVDVESSDRVACDEEIETLEDFLQGTEFRKTTARKATSSPTSGASVSVKAMSPFPFSPERQTILNALSQNKSLYGVRALMDDDVVAHNRTPLSLMDQLDDIGLVLDTALDIHAFPDLDGDCLDAPLPLYFLFACERDAEAISAAVTIPVARIQVLDFMEVLEGTADVTSAYDDPEAVDAASDVAEAPKAKARSKTATRPSRKTAGEKPQKPPVASLDDVTPAEADTPASDEAPRVEGAVQDPGLKNSAAVNAETVRVKVELLNNLMNQAGEMVLLRNQLMRRLEGEASRIQGLQIILQNLDLTTTNMQEHIMQTRMQPLGSIFGKFPRVVRDIARQLNKDITLTMSGEDVELDKSLIEALSDPLTHLIRNCCDHGIETTEERARVGKQPTGRIFLQAFHEGGQINIRVSDDGRGIDPERIARKAIDSGAMNKADVERMSDKEKTNLIFLPGLSTAEKVTDLSGRGVGMDVVRTNIEKLGGSISLDSELGSGSSVLLRLPLTLAIIPSLIIAVGDQRLAMPQVNLVELIFIKAEETAKKIERIGGATVLRLRGKLLPLVYLADVLGLERVYTDPQTGQAQPERRDLASERRQRDPEQHPMAEAVNEAVQSGREFAHRGPQRRAEAGQDFYVVVVKVGISQYGLIVDSIHDLEEIVVKPLSGYLKDCQCFSGATIMGDGKVAMILDVGGTAAYKKLSFTDAKSDELLVGEQRRRHEGGDVTRMEIILFKNAADEIFAVPLASVLRLEKVQIGDIEHIGSREYLSYRGKGLPLLRMESCLPVAPIDTHGRDDVYMIIPKISQGLVGLLASEIVDTLTVEVTMQKAFDGRCEGVTGAALVNGHLTVFIDPEGLVLSSGIVLEPELAHV